MILLPNLRILVFILIFNMAIMTISFAATDVTNPDFVQMAVYGDINVDQFGGDPMVRTPIYKSSFWSSTWRYVDEYYYPADCPYYNQQVALTKSLGYRRVTNTDNPQFGTFQYTITWKALRVSEANAAGLEQFTDECSYENIGDTGGFVEEVGYWTKALFKNLSSFITLFTFSAVVGMPAILLYFLMIPFYLINAYLVLALIFEVVNVLASLLPW